MYKEGITEQEFSAAIASLTAFAGVDLSSLQTLPDLSKVGSCVGRALRIVTLALGEEKDHQGTPVSNLEGDNTRYLNRFDDQDSFSYLVVTTSVAGLIQRWNSSTPKNRSDPSYSDGHWVTFPTDLSMENSIVAPSFLRAYIGGRVPKSYDLKGELHPEAVQGYARVLQESLQQLTGFFLFGRV